MSGPAAFQRRFSATCDSAHGREPRRRGFRRSRELRRKATTCTRGLNRDGCPARCPWTRPGRPATRSRPRRWPAWAHHWVLGPGHGALRRRVANRSSRRHCRPGGAATCWWGCCGVRSTSSRTAVVEDSRGMQYLAVLLANPEHEIQAIELAAGPGPPSGDLVAVASQPILDEAALRASGCASPSCTRRSTSTTEATTSAGPRGCGPNGTGS